jgi:hypothetical protein
MSAISKMEFECPKRVRINAMVLNVAESADQKNTREQSAVQLPS